MTGVILEDGVNTSLEFVKTWFRPRAAGSGFTIGLTKILSVKSKPGLLSLIMWSQKSHNFPDFHLLACFPLSVNLSKTLELFLCCDKFLQSCVVLEDTSYLMSPRACRRFWVPVWQLSLVFAVTKRSPKYCRRVWVISLVLTQMFMRSFLKNTGWSFIKPWGKWVQMSCPLMSLLVSHHSKAKYFWLLGAKSMLKKASFRSRTEYHFLSCSNKLSKV